MIRRARLLCLVFVFGAAAMLAAQTPAAVPTPKAYADGGRRDPFVSLIVPKAAPNVSANSRPKPAVAGLAGLAVSDAVVKGLIKSGTTFIALLQGPDGRTYMARRQDRLQDGVVTRIESDGVVFTERAADATGIVHSRDVRKPLRATNSGSGGQL